MSEKKKLTQTIIDSITKLSGLEAVQLSSELAEGDYTLEDGTKFRIDADGNLVDVKAPDAAEAEAQEAAKAEEEAVAMAAQKKQAEDLATVTEELKLAKEKITELEAEQLKLTKTKKIVTAPKTEKFEKIELTSNMTKVQRAQARFLNNKHK